MTMEKDVELIFRLVRTFDKPSEAVSSLLIVIAACIASSEGIKTEADVRKACREIQPLLIELAKDALYKTKPK